MTIVITFNNGDQKKIEGVKEFGFEEGFFFALGDGDKRIAAGTSVVFAQEVKE